MKSKLRNSVAGLLLAVCLPAMAAADRVRDAIIQQLVEQGYERVEVSKTWLGRYRFIAYGGDRVREIVFNPATGEILRDYLRMLGDDDDRSAGVLGQLLDLDDDDDDRDRDRDRSGASDDDDDDDGDKKSSSGSGSDDDDDDERDDDDSDNSGSSKDHDNEDDEDDEDDEKDEEDD